MDFRSSVVQMLKRDWTEGQMVKSPAAEHRVASAMMNRGGNFDENRVDTSLKTLLEKGVQEIGLETGLGVP